MTTFDQHKNFAISTVAAPPVPALAGLTLSVAAAEGALFPAAPFNAVVFPANTAPTIANAEIVRVTSKGAGDNWTIVRTQEATAARSIQVGDRIMNSITVKALTDIEQAVSNAGGVVALAAQPVLETGVVGQIRAGRPLAVADFTTLLGLSTPPGLFGLGDLSNLGSGGALANKGAVTFGSGITGATTEAAIFHGGVTDALYIADTGAADPFRIPYGSVSCWFRVAKSGVSQNLVSKFRGAAGSHGYILAVFITSGVVEFDISNDGSTDLILRGITPITDDRWHHAVGTYDGTMMSLYLDGILEAATMQGSGPIFASPAPLNIGSFGADGATNAGNPFWGRMDETFITPDVLSPDQVRMLYATKIAHTFGAVPVSAKVAVRRQRKGAPLTSAMFSTPPLHLYNFQGGLLTDQGSLAVALTNNNATLSSPGADGAQGNGFNFVYGLAQNLSATDAGLPAGTSARTFGCWFKSVSTVVTMIAYGTTDATNDVRLVLSATGAVQLSMGGQNVASPSAYNDGQWHFAVGVLDPAASDALLYKLYVDGKLVASNSAALIATVLGGAGAFRIGRGAGASVIYFQGQEDASFITGYAASPDEIAKWYAAGSLSLGVSPKEPGMHVEGMDAASVYLIADPASGVFSQDLLDLEVAA